MQMVKPWEDQTGATVKYTGTRDLNTVLTTGVASGVLPDLAGLPGPGQMAEWADSLVDLSRVLDMSTYTSETAPALVQLGQVNGKAVGVFIKTSVKGLIWYDPKVVGDLSSSAPATWDALQQLISTDKSKAAAPWCLGVESGAASGWPGTDWIEDIILRQSGPDVYNSWWQGKTKWTDPAIKSAWQTFGQVVAQSYGGAKAVNATNFANAGDPLFKTPPGCLFLHQASFITGLGAVPEDASRAPTTTSSRSPTSTRQYIGRRRGRGRPVRHVPQHAGIGLADGVPRDRPGPGHLGQDRRRAVRQQERHRLSRRHQQALCGDAPERQDLRVRRVGPDAQRDEQRLLVGHRPVREPPGSARLDPGVDLDKAQTDAYAAQ